jgi:GR25 family glycosyltransferase involved in LPS biosynthesis
MNLTRAQKLLQSLPRDRTASQVLHDTPVHVISLKSAKARQEQLTKSAALYGVNVVWVDGVDPRPSTTVRAKAKVTASTGVVTVTAHNGTIHRFKIPNNVRMSYGELGCTLAHLMAMRAILDSGKPYGLVGEDDIVFDPIPHWDKTLSEIIKWAPHDWEILNLQPTKYVNSSGRCLYSQDQSMGTVFYCVRSAAVQRMWNKCTHDGLFCLERMDRGPKTADIILYKAFRTYVNYRFCTAIWKNDCGTLSQIHAAHDDLHIIRSLRVTLACVKHVLRRSIIKLCGHGPWALVTNLKYNMGILRLAVGQDGLGAALDLLAPLAVSVELTRSSITEDYRFNDNPELGRRCKPKAKKVVHHKHKQYVRVGRRA